jgi:hypothetical protein
MEEGHEHVRGHSDNCWEFRPGYLDRFHWILARRRLTHLFQVKVVPAVRKAALAAHEVELRSRKMWPMPAGIMAAQWLAEVETSELSKADQIQLLQNEYIYRERFGRREGTPQIAEKIEQLGGLVLASLDVGDAAGIQNVARDRDLIEDRGVGGGDLVPVDGRPIKFSFVSRVVASATL